MKQITFYKNIVVLGAAESGIGAALLAKQKGHDVFVSDASAIKESRKQELRDAQIAFEEQHTMPQLLRADLLIKSPGIPANNEVVRAFKEAGKPVMSEIDFAYCYKENAKIIAITGSNGKSTTTSLIYHILKTDKQDVALVGNIGYSFAKQIALQPTAIYVVEVSSFQLDDIHFFKPDIAILLNLSEDHLDRYDKKYENYIRAKFAISKFQNNNDYFIYNDDDQDTHQFLSSFTIHAQTLSFTMEKKLQQGAYIDKEQMFVATANDSFDMNLNSLPLKGRHNKYNMLAASLATKVMHIRSNSIREAMQSFKGLEHRMETIAMIRGVEYINDSKATNINSTWYALEGMTKQTILILGGVDKGDKNDYNIIKNLVEKKVRAIICLGKNNAKIVNFFRNIVPVYDLSSIHDAVQIAYEKAQQGDAVLLSPACASFDLFNNFEDRGNQFKQLVKKL